MVNLDLIRVVIASFFGIIYLLLLTNWRFSKKKTYGITALFMGINAVVTMLTFLSPVIRLVDFQRRLIYILLGFAFACLISKYRDARTIFSYFSACMFVEMQDLIYHSFCCFLDSPLTRLICILAIFLIILLTIHYAIRTIFLESMELTEKGWGKFSIVPFCILVSFILVISYPSPLTDRREDIPAAVSLCISIILFEGIFYMLFRQLQIHMRTVEDMSGLRGQVASLEKHMQSVRESEEKIRIFQHDLKHFTNAVQACLKSGNYDDIYQILSSMNLAISNISRPATYYCSNSILNSVLDTYVQMAENAGIRVMVKVAFPEKSNINYEGLSVVLANGIENAIHACENMREEERRQIHVICAPAANRFFLEISNTYEGEVRFDSESGLPKTDREGHGFGTRSIAMFAKRCGGASNFFIKDGWFFMRLNIPVTGTQSEKEV